MPWATVGNRLVLICSAHLMARSLPLRPSLPKPRPAPDNTDPRRTFRRLQNKNAGFGPVGSVIVFTSYSTIHFSQGRRFADPGDAWWPFRNARVESGFSTNNVENWLHWADFEAECRLWFAFELLYLTIGNVRCREHCARTSPMITPAPHTASELQQGTSFFSLFGAESGLFLLLTN